MNFLKKSRSLSALFSLALTFSLASSCIENESTNDSENESRFNNSEIIFLLIDESSIDNGNEPNNFSEIEVNDNIAEIGQRQILKYFLENTGRTIDLFTGQVGDEGWFAPKSIPSSWINAGPTKNGLQNYLTPGPGLGASGDDPEVLLDEIPNVTPLRATGLKMLEGETVYALVYDSDISINYSPLVGNLQGSNLGIVAFDVLNVTRRMDGSTSDLPRVTVRIRNATEVKNLNLGLFSNAPIPQSSSEPFDINPPATVPSVNINPAE
ncbi:hypothetical protein Belba_1000 [Belliella baltica DSM 15883]|uniref:Uncharacterized protein n=1 Tax=Belliella baltica (strain DSM 15883 / CIP 108006 / LMG 21964 / BA134) TaxID=866536 RepID=I3Z324_BELBD|nr:hypothetical protein [Belliella baltica]AFL83642.1 hypothetical protein Belba_1000 [Belliella baltica DSM 15883]